MIKFTRHTLDNGLTMICNTDTSTPFVSVNILYKVGARDEDPNRTGFAHLFEHLMFGGSKHIADYDYHVQKAIVMLSRITTTRIITSRFRLPISKRPCG